jgi:hypothetical protein
MARAGVIAIAKLSKTKVRAMAAITRVPKKATPTATTLNLAALGNSYFGEDGKGAHKSRAGGAPIARPVHAAASAGHFSNGDAKRYSGSMLSS